MNSRKSAASGKLTVLRMALHGKDTKVPVYNERKSKKNTSLEKKTVYHAMLKRKTRETSISLN